jgi:hypothetical protein
MKRAAWVVRVARLLSSCVPTKNDCSLHWINLQVDGGATDDNLPRLIERAVPTFGSYFIEFALVKPFQFV